MEGADTSVLMTAEQVATLLTCSERQVWNLRSQGRLPQPVQIGGSRITRWRRADILAWIEDGCQPPKRR